MCCQVSHKVSTNCPDKKNFNLCTGHGVGRKDLTYIQNILVIILHFKLANSLSINNLLKTIFD